MQTEAELWKAMQQAMLILQPLNEGTQAIS